jgi:hypothetical protein
MESVARSVVRLPNHHLAKPDQNGKYKAQIPAGHGCQFDGVFLVMRETAKTSPCARASRQTPPTLTYWYRLHVASSLSRVFNHSTSERVYSVPFEKNIRP